MHSPRRPAIPGLEVPITTDNLWCGFLDAGAKSSLVVRDDSLLTGNPSTVYLYNQQRGAILEFQRAVVESKLRELTAEQRHEVDALLESFNEVRAGFRPKRTAPVAPPRRPKVIARDPDEADEEVDEEAAPPFEDEEFEAVPLPDEEEEPEEEEED